MIALDALDFVLVLFFVLLVVEQLEQVVLADPEKIQVLQRGLRELREDCQRSGPVHVPAVKQYHVVNELLVGDQLKPLLVHQPRLQKLLIQLRVEVRLRGVVDGFVLVVDLD